MGACQAKDDRVDKAEQDINGEPIDTRNKEDASCGGSDYQMVSLQKTLNDDPPQKEGVKEENPIHDFKVDTLSSARQDEPPTPTEKTLKPSEPEEAGASDGKSTITVRIGMIRGCREVSWLPKSGSDLYLVLRNDDKDDELYRSQPVRDTVWPIWKETFTIPWKKGENLEFELMEDLYDAYDIKGQMKESQTLVKARGVLRSEEFEKNGFNGTLLMDSRIHLDTLLRIWVKHEGQEFTEDTPMQFSVDLKKAEDSPLGLLIDQNDGRTLCVRKVEASSVIDTYNKSAAPEKQIRPRDFIVIVNGKSESSADMITALKSNNLELTIKRPMEVAIGIAPTLAKVYHGIEFHSEMTMDWLQVANIKDGFNAALHNADEAKDKESCRLLAGDRIVRAFGTWAGFGSDLARTARQSSGLQCIVFRPYDEQHPAAAFYRR